MKISIIITVYNVANYLEECIESALNQTYKDIEIIAINDGSTDNSLNILNLYNDEIIVLNQSNKGSSNALNRGIEKSTGQLISFLDGDDFWVKDKLEKQISIFEQFPEMDMSFGQIEQFLSPELMEIPDRFRFKRGPQSGFLKGTCIAKKVLFDTYGLFKESKSGLDFIIWFDMVRSKGVEYHQLEEVLVMRRIRENSLSQSAEYYPELIQFLKNRLDQKRT